MGEFGRIKATCFHALRIRMLLRCRKMFIYSVTFYDCLPLKVTCLNQIGGYRDCVNK